MKLLTKTIALGMALIITAGAFAQSPTSPANATRQRKATTGDAPQTTSEAKPSTDPATARDAAVDKDKSLGADGPFSEPTPAAVKPVTSKGDKSKSKEPNTPLAEVTADAQTNRRDQAAEEEAIVPYYNNFF
ncbi:MAG: hypothetical protein QOH42_1766, partial [Blastocatellia bacterium]|nr:hypothetical protein [Blastocatellia bacterium]